MIRKSDPELDQHRPDFAALLHMAGEFNEKVQARIVSPLVKEQFLARLPKDDGKTKLAFRLADKELVATIPDCLKAESQSYRSRGPMKDLWDIGVTLPDWATSWFSKTPVTIGYVLLAIVGLLSMEWLTRKLLRLA
jgi:hypothetical protein